MEYRLIRPDELYHYGVKGMKWGVRHDYEPVGRNRGQAVQSSGRRASPKSKTSAGKSAVAAINNRNKRRLNREKIKRYAKIGLAIAGVSLAAYGAYRIHQNGAFNRLMLSGQKRISETIPTIEPKKLDVPKTNIAPSFPGSKYGIKQCATSKADDLNIINRELNISDDGLDILYHGGDIKNLNVSDQLNFQTQQRLGNFTNCTMCTATAGMRRKGYDVVAGTSSGPLDIDKTLQWWKNGVYESVSGAKMTKPEDMVDFNADRVLRAFTTKSSKTDIKQITKRLSSMGNGASGELQVAETGRMGHSVEFEVTKSGVKIYDNQCRRVYNSVEEYFKKSKYDPAYSAWMRTDNLEPNIEQMIKDGAIKPR